MTPAQMASVHAAAFTQSRPWSAEEFEELLARSDTFVFGDEICFAIVRVLGPEAELLTIATDPAHRLKGHALAVMKEWHSAAQTRGAERAFLDVASDNAPALALYASCGYAACGRRKGYYRRGPDERVDAIVMQLDLSASCAGVHASDQETG
ncbi:GNAT family N-acetyltransferase [Lutimaribacter marinistellae]|uniref:GNAT family N-acetyltransferase n=1 Tax=Lutimaribacter marinistellae TaxID=1820329 RepID=A0ABV7TCJ8_9RHOB